MKVWAIASTALRRLFRDRSNIFFVLILPIGIILIIGSLFGGSFDPTIGVAVEDGAGGLGEQLAVAIEAREDVDVERFSDAGAVVTAVERGNVQAGVVVPAGYQDALAAGESVEVGFVARPDNAVFQTVVLAEVRRQGAEVRAARFAADRGEVGFDEALSVAEEAQASLPGVEVDTEVQGEPLFAGVGRFDLGASSQLVLFMFLTGLTGSAAIIETRRLGVARRMLSTPTSAATVVAGEGLGRYAVVMLQGLYILFATLLLFGVDWGDPAGAAAVLVLFGAVSAGTAMLMGTLFRNDQQAGGVGVMLGLGVAALGGCMIPLEFFSDTMRMVAHLTPHAWALDAFSVLVRDDGNITDIAPELGVLAAYAAVVIGIASIRLRRAVTST